MTATRTRSRRRDDGSMPMTMLLLIVSSALIMAVASVVFGQQGHTRNDVQRVKALGAAQTGLEIATGAIRTSTTSDGFGDPRALPCAVLTGRTSAATGDATYSVRVYYTKGVPPSGDVQWATQPANRWDCGATATSMPAHALIESTGTYGVQRTLTATYSFTTVTQNDKIAGGLIRAYSTKGGNFCISAASATSLSGSQLLIRSCDAQSPLQRFAYQAGLTITLAELTTPTGQRLCLDGGATPAAGNPVRLQPCAPAPIRQQVWGSDDHSVFYLQPTATTILCLRSSKGDTDGATVRLAGPTPAGTCVRDWNDTATFITDPRFGAGKAGPATGQLVNSHQFGRCIDVTANDVTTPYLVVFPCKQPLTGPVLWNQNWVLPSATPGTARPSGPIYTTTGGTAYCLQNPGTISPPGNYLTLQACNPGAVLPTSLQWTINGDTGRRSTSFRIESSHMVAPGGPNTCMSVTDPTAADPDVWRTFNLTISKLTTAPCDDSDLQKWNIVPQADPASLTDIMEQ
jgi:hypothetical protein